MLRIAGFAALVVGVGVGVSGYLFISQYDISPTRTSVIEASLIQIAHLRYIIAAILGVASAVCFAGSQVASANNR